MRRKAPTFSGQSAHWWQCGCQPQASAAIYPQHPRKIPATHLCQGWVDPRTVVRLEVLSIEQSNDLNGNRSCDLPACRIAFIVCNLLCVSTVRIKVIHQYIIKQDRHYCIYIRFIISKNGNRFRLLLSHLLAFCISSLIYNMIYILDIQNARRWLSKSRNMLRLLDIIKRM
jgi:hypothetical protein